jgi:predicted MFS family arabinose efflux permease
VDDVGRVPVTDIGFYSGTIESSFAVVQMCVMLFWGQLSDRVGRKPVLISCLVGVAVACILFGFSTTIWEMVLFRCVAGFMGASLVTIRTMITENSTLKTQGTSFAWFSVAGNMGVFLGPLIGGALANPIEQYPGFPRVQLLVDYPYCLPGIATGLLGLSAAAACFFFLNETLPKTPRAGPEAAAAGSPASRMTVMQILKSPGVVNVFVVNAFMFILSFGYFAVVPVFAYTPTKYGGWGLQPRYISLFLGGLGLSQALWAFFVFPRLHRRIGNRRMVQVFTSLFWLNYVPVPLFSALLRQDTDAARRLFWVLLPIYLAIMPGTSMVFPATHLTVNNVSPSPHALGTITGMALSMANAFRSVAPAAFTSLYGVFIRHGLWLSNLYWGVFIALSVGWAVAARYLPPDPTKK